MSRLSVSALCLALVVSQPGCKIVKTLPPDEKAVAADASGDDARTAARLDETFDSKLIPYIHDNALSVETLRGAIATGLDAAGKAHGTRGSGQGAAWNFPVTGGGKIVQADLDTRARTAGIDTDEDGTADITVQLGPVIKGTSLRDVAPFFSFDDFRDQIEFAKLSRALNDKASTTIHLPEGDIVGKTAQFTGVVALKSASEPLLVTVTEFEVMP